MLPSTLLSCKLSSHFIEQTCMVSHSHTDTTQYSNPTSHNFSNISRKPARHSLHLSNLHVIPLVRVWCLTLSPCITYTVCSNCSHACSYGNLFSLKIWHTHPCYILYNANLFTWKLRQRLRNLLHWYRLIEDTTRIVATRWRWPIGVQWSPFFFFCV